MPDIKWIKINTDIFDNEKIRIIEDLPEGDTMLVIWLKLLTLAGKKNDCGLIYITRDLPYDVKTLSKVMQRKEEVVSLALNTFKSFEMIDIVGNVISVTNWGLHQNAEGLDKIREQNRLRQIKYRGKNKENKPKKASCNVTSRYSNAIDKNRIDKIRKEYNIYGEYKNVKLTSKEYNKLITDNDLDIVTQAIEYLSSYKIEKDYKTKSDNLTIRRWVIDAVSKTNGPRSYLSNKDRVHANIAKMIKEEQDPTNTGGNLLTGKQT